jgi:hypothetical protein
MPILSNPSASNMSGSIANALTQPFGFSQAATRDNLSTLYGKATGSKSPSVKISYPDAAEDWRVRLTLPNYANYFYNDPNNTLLTPLKQSGEIFGAGGGADNAGTAVVGSLLPGGLGGQTTAQQRIGVVFPYTPTLSVTHTANYESQKLTHTNYASYFYNNSEVSAITIAGEFTVQNLTEGQYLLATIYFLRAATKMFFGADQNPAAGNPPPILYLNGYGQYYLPNVPVVVTSFSHTMPSDVDYMDVSEPGFTYYPAIQNPRKTSTRLPTSSTVTVTVQPVYSRISQSQSFSLQDFANGALINQVGLGRPASAFGATRGTQVVKTPPVGGFL